MFRKSSLMRRNKHVVLFICDGRLPFSLVTLACAVSSAADPVRWKSTDPDLKEKAGPDHGTVIRW